MITLPQQQAHLTRLREVLAKTDLVLLETRWLGWNAGYRFRCPHGHETVRAGTHISRFLIQCPTCRNASHALAKLTQLREIAERAGGECLSEVYQGADERYFFRCQQGHHFESRGSKVFAGSWCRRCAQFRHSEAMRNAHGLERLKTIAQQRGGACLAGHYTKLADTYRFRCAVGHECNDRV